MTNQTSSKYRYNQMNSENNKEIFERQTIHKLLKEVYEYNLAFEYPDKVTVNLKLITFKNLPSSENTNNILKTNLD